MTAATPASDLVGASGTDALQIRVRGRVQGVGFRPTVWRLARELGLRGTVLNDAEGVLIRAAGEDATLADFLRRLETERPPLAAIESIDVLPYAGPIPGHFEIIETTVVH